MLALTLAFDLRPGVLQAHRAVEDQSPGRRTGVYAEVADALELIARARSCSGQARLDLGIREHTERVGVQELPPVGVRWRQRRVLDREEPVVQPHLGVKGVGSRHPVECGFYLPAVGRVPPARGGIVCAPELGDGPRI